MPTLTINIARAGHHFCLLMKLKAHRLQVSSAIRLITKTAMTHYLCRVDMNVKNDVYIGRVVA